MAKLSIRQNKQITSRVTITPAEVTRIKAQNYDWSYYHLGDIIGKIRDFYQKEQIKLCAFCKLPFRDEIQVEHLIPKAGTNPRKEFSYHPLNLVVACRNCNTKKSTNNDFVEQIWKHYPMSGIYFKIIHPHFDNYFEHIKIVDKSRYVAITSKGFNTIKRCGLYESKMSDLLVYYMKYEDDPLIQGVIRFRELQGDFKETINKFIDKIFN